MEEAESSQPSAPMPIDFRHRWLSETISKLLGITDGKFADTLLSDNNEKVRCFFDDAINDFTDCNKRLLFTWRTFYDKLVEETISVLEEGNDYLHSVFEWNYWTGFFSFVAVAPPTPPPEVIKKKTKGKGKNRLNYLEYQSIKKLKISNSIGKKTKDVEVEDGSRPNSVAGKGK